MTIEEYLAEEVREEYLRCLDKIGNNDPYYGPDTLGIKDVLRAHFLIADFFYSEGYGMGGIGPQNWDLLHSALYRQHVSFNGKRKWTTKFEICATLLFGLVKDHAFHDANKRTAFLSSAHYLFARGRIPSISHKEFEDFFVDVADDKLSKYNRYADLKKSGETDAEIIFISDFLHRNTREIDKREYMISYKELKKILNRFDCDITDPNKNFSEIIKTVKKKKILTGKEYAEEQRVMQVSCPGMTRQVSSSTIRDIRKALRLTAKDGVDSQEFYKGADGMGGLMAYYREPLLSLANR